MAGVLFFKVMQFAIQSASIKRNVVEFNILFHKDDKLARSGTSYPTCMTVGLIYDFDLLC